MSDGRDGGCWAERFDWVVLAIALVALVAFAVTTPHWAPRPEPEDAIDAQDIASSYANCLAAGGSWGAPANKREAVEAVNAGHTVEGGVFDGTTFGGMGLSEKRLRSASHHLEYSGGILRYSPEPVRMEASDGW